MAGLMSRASIVVKAKMSKLLDRAEDPGETLDYSYEKQLELLQNVKRGVADVVTAKKRLQLQAAQLEQSIVKLDTQARQALAAGREDLARRRWSASPAVQAQLQGLDQQVRQLEDQQEKLVASERQLSAKVEAFRSQKETIKAQYSAAEAQVRIGEAATGIGEQMADTGLAIQRAKDKTEQMTARAARDRRADSPGRSRTSPPTRRSSTASSRDLVEVAGRLGACADEGRGRLRRGEEGAPASDRPADGRGSVRGRRRGLRRGSTTSTAGRAALETATRSSSRSCSGAWPRRCARTASACRTRTSRRRRGSSHRTT